MSPSFDPYRVWLHVKRENRPKNRPPNHYQLLGLDLFEEDPDVIGNAADMRIAHVGTFEAGPHAEDAQRILDELAVAKECLLDSARKEAYDAGLREGLNQAAAATSEPPAPPEAADSAPHVTMPKIELVKQQATGPHRVQRRPSRMSRGLLATLVLCFVVVVAGAVWLMITLTTRGPSVAVDSGTHTEVAEAETASNGVPDPVDKPSSAEPVEGIEALPTTETDTVKLPKAAEGDDSDNGAPAIDEVLTADGEPRLPERSLADLVDGGGEQSGVGVDRPAAEAIQAEVVRLRETLAEYGAVELADTSDPAALKVKQEQLVQALFRLSEREDVRFQAAIRVASLQESLRVAREAENCSLAIEAVARMAESNLCAKEQVADHYEEMFRDAVEADDCDSAVQVFQAASRHDVQIPTDDTAKLLAAVHEAVHEMPADWKKRVAIIDRLALADSERLANKARILLAAAQHRDHLKAFDTYHEICAALLDLIPGALHQGNLRGANLLLEKADACPVRLAAKDAAEKAVLYELRKALVARRSAARAACEAWARALENPTDVDHQDHEAIVAFLLEAGEFEMALPHMEAINHALASLLKSDEEARLADMVGKAEALHQAAGDYERPTRLALLERSMTLLTSAHEKNDDPLLRRRIDSEMVRLGEDIAKLEESGKKPEPEDPRISPLVWAKIRTAIDRAQFSFSDWGGGMKHEQETFRFLPEEGAVLVGVNYHQVEDWEVISAMQFVFVTEHGAEITSPMYAEKRVGEVHRVYAPTGLAITAINVRQGEAIRAFQVGFGPIRTTGIGSGGDVTEYSRWYGPRTDQGKSGTLFVAEKASIIGVEGRYGHLLGRFRLIGVK